MRLARFTGRAGAPIQGSPSAGLAYRPLIASTTVAPGGGQVGSASVEALVQRAIHRLVLVALAARALVLPVIMLSLLAHAQVHHVTFPPPSLIAGVGLVVAVNVALLVYVGGRRRPQLLVAPGFLVLDVGVAAAMYLWVALTLGARRFFHPEWDALWLYLMGTVSLWTGVRGVQVAAMIIGLGAVLQVAMAWVSGLAVGSISWVVVAAREAWLVAALLVTQAVLSLSQQGALAAAEEGLRAGQERERARMLRTMHDSVLQSLEALLLESARQDLPVGQRLDRLRAGVRRQAGGIRLVLRRDAQVPAGGLSATLEALVEEFTGRGLRVQLVAAELDDEPPTPVAQALVGATHEALANVAKHAEVEQVVVRAASVEDGVEVTVRDHGRGFDVDRPGFGITESIVGRMHDVGGRAVVWSAPGRGTRVTLWGPR